MRRPFTPRRAGRLEIRHRASALVESFGSCPAIERSRIAQSSRCARTARPGPATTRTPPRPSGCNARRSASSRRCRRTRPAGGSSRRYRCRSRQRQPRRDRRRRSAGRAARHQHRRSRPAGAATDSPPARRPRSCSTSPSRTRPCWPCPETRRLAQQIGGDGALVGRHEGPEDAAAGRGAHALGAEQILDRQRNAGRAARLPARQRRIRRIGLRQRALGGDGDVGVQPRVQRLDRVRDAPPSAPGGELLARAARRAPRRA